MARGGFRKKQTQPYSTKPLTGPEARLSPKGRVTRLLTSVDQLTTSAIQIRKEARISFGSTSRIENHNSTLP